MQVMIGAAIKRLRQGKGLTQEQLAEVMGVTAQAVSRWENDQAYPDVTMLPALAVFFGTSVDDIIGMDMIRSKKTLNAVHGEVNSLVAEGRYAEAVDIARKAYRMYPGDGGMIMMLGETLAHMSDDAEALAEAITLEETALKMPDVSVKAKVSTMVNLVYLYMMTERTDDAQKMWKALPHIWESRELMAPAVSCDAEHDAALKKALKSGIAFLYSMIERAEEKGMPLHVQLGADLSPDKSADEMIDTIRNFLK